MIQPIPQVSHVSHLVSTFASPIYYIDVPKGPQIPNMKMYDRTKDHVEHVVQHRECVEIVPFPQYLKEAYLCKVFC